MSTPTSAVFRAATDDAYPATAGHNGQNPLRKEPPLMTWPTALALFYVIAAICLLWHHAQRLAEQIVEENTAMNDHNTSQVRWRRIDALRRAHGLNRRKTTGSREAL